MLIVLKCPVRHAAQLQNVISRMHSTRTIDAGRSMAALLRGNSGLRERFITRDLSTSSAFLDKAAKPTTSKSLKDMSSDKSVTEEMLNDLYNKKSVAVTKAEKVKQAGMDFTYIIVAAVGLAALTGLGYAIGSEFFSSNSAPSIMNKALKVINNSDTILDYFGTPLKSYGQETSRRRRRHPARLEYEKDGESRMRMLFYIQGPHARGSVHLEMRKDETGTYDFRYLYAESDEVPSRTFVLVDNRT